MSFQPNHLHQYDLELTFSPSISTAMARVLKNHACCMLKANSRKPFGDRGMNQWSRQWIRIGDSWKLLPAGKGHLLRYVEHIVSIYHLNYVQNTKQVPKLIGQFGLCLFFSLRLPSKKGGAITEWLTEAFLR